MRFILEKGSPVTLGVSKSNNGVNFAVVVPAGKSCNLILFRKGSDAVVTKIPLEEQDSVGNVRCVNLQGLEYERLEYVYEIDGRIAPDKYARRIITDRYGKHAPEWTRCGFCFERYDWGKDVRPMLSMEEVVLYRLHVRGFTAHTTSKVNERGTFRGMEKKLSYLQELGVNQIEVMPAYEFRDDFEAKPGDRIAAEAGKKRKNYWGYADENYYFSPKQKYSFSPCADVELKNLIRHIHKLKMELIMEFYFPKSTPVSMMLDCLRFWTLAYHVDGFHLTGEYIPVEEIAVEPIFGNLKIYYEQMKLQRYSGLIKPQQKQKHLAQSTDDYAFYLRKFLKGDSGSIQKAAEYISRNEDDFGYVNYITSHNGFTLLDLVTYEEKHNEANLEDNIDGSDMNLSWNCGFEGRTQRKSVNLLRLRQMKNAWVILLLSQAVPAILAGDEHCNSQSGNNNAYCQDNSVGWVNWKDNKINEEMPAFVKKLISFRKEHPVLHMPGKAKTMDTLGNGYPDLSFHGEKAWFVDYRKPEACMSILFCGDYAGTPDDFILVIYNMSWRMKHMALPKLPTNLCWWEYLNTEEPLCGQEQPRFLEEQKEIRIEGRSCKILIGKCHGE